MKGLFGVSMADSPASFPLREATAEELSRALSECFRDFSGSYFQATFVAGFVEVAQSSGVKDTLSDRVLESLEFADPYITKSDTTSRTNEDVARELAEMQLKTAQAGTETAALVLLHSACERFLWRLVRFGLVANRAQGLKFIAQQKLRVAMLSQQGMDASVDNQLEKWWRKLERRSLKVKWDCLVGLLGYPRKLANSDWHFDREMLMEFDTVRHNAVHGHSDAGPQFDLARFSEQLYRAQLVWVTCVARALKLRLTPKALLGFG